MSMYSWEGLSFITSAAGVPDHFHPETLACTNLDVAKVFVLADLSKELPDKINYVIQGKDTIVQFIYPWLPPKCVKCGRWGHFDTLCKQNKGEKRVEEVGEGSTSVGKEGNKVEEGSEGKNKVEENPGNGWKEVSMEKVGRSPKSQLNQVIITTPSRYEALSNADEFGFEIDKDEIEEMEEGGVEIAEDLCQKWRKRLRKVEEVELMRRIFRYG
ncbi:hypothetical protein DY000_02024431 [Brassica cretica]|uniref:CCHC-type domain-containing protein n=1 Tax=Brassica cretica TaxID=69181 RepID=A0ABQ7E6U7_BRACR|nr:hypothetical protein DY000_02024431 [Brassica cretica]